jgi:hypothetical protein
MNRTEKHALKERIGEMHFGTTICVGIGKEAEDVLILLVRRGKCEGEIMAY